MAGDVICRSIECAIDWYGSQAANNTFTLLGAMATFVAVLVALNLARIETARQHTQAVERARLVAAAALPALRSTKSAFSDVDLQLSWKLSQGVKHFALARYLADLADRHFVEIPIDTLMLLAPLEGNQAGYIATAYADLKALVTRQSILRALGDHTDIDEPASPGLRDEAKGVIAAIRSLDCAERALSRASLERSHRRIR